jgi:selenocysteine lyase/cysteine desulfurase
LIRRDLMAWAKAAWGQDGDPSGGSAPLYRHLESLITGGGDGRLTVCAPGGRGAYGTTPFPRNTLLDFGSSTASSISLRAYDCAFAARAELLADAARHGLGRAFDASVERQRRALKRLFRCKDAEIIFTPSGTDAQLLTLALAKIKARAPLSVLIAGADQSGSGVTHAARGRHFADRTAQGAAVTKGASVAGFSDVAALEIAFAGRDAAAMDAAVLAAAEQALAGDGEMLLLSMDCSKLGWRAPSDAVLDAIAARWPGRAHVAIDACQMRLSRARLAAHLARGHLVLMTGSKFFGGPPFSGALLMPPSWAAAIDGADALPPGLGDYVTLYDLPPRWENLRAGLTAAPNFSAWLRWEAALTEIEAWFAIPTGYRDALLRSFAAGAEARLKASPQLRLLPHRPHSAEDIRTIFAFLPCRDGAALPQADCARLYRAMDRDLSEHLPAGASARDRAIAARLCAIGQPVLLAEGAALRISASARTVGRVWPLPVEEAAAEALGALDAVCEKLVWLMERLDWLTTCP